MLDIAEINNGFEVKFEYKPWLVDAIKKIPGASFRNKGGEKFWHVPARSETELFSLAKTVNKTSGTETQEVRHVEIGEIEPLPELTVKIDLQMELFSYQRNGVQYGINKKKFINGDDMGLGKTAQSIATLVGGGAKCILIICPATLKENWKREWKMWTGRDAIILTDRTKNTWPQYFKIGLSNVFIVNYESLKKYFVKEINKPANKPLRLNHIVFHDTINLFDAVVLDELHRCLPYESKISTNKGLVSIGEIVENNMKDLMVYSYNIYDNSVTLKSIKNVWKNDLCGRKLYRIKHNEGELYATGNHKIYTSGGWKKEVSQIKSGEELLLLRSDIYDDNNGKINSKILFKELRGKRDKQQARSQEKNNRSNIKTFVGKKMRSLRNCFLHKTERQSISEDKILHTKLFSKVENVNPRSSGYQQIPGKKREVANSGNKSNERPEFKKNAFRQNEGQQSYAKSRDKSEGNSIKARQNISFKRRKRSTHSASKIASQSITIIQPGNGISDCNKRRKRYVSKPSALLQSRYWNIENKNCDRGRWPQPQNQEVAVSGQAQNGNIKCVRVESVEVYEPTSPEQYAFSSIRNQTVYDLEIEGNHNYFADNILVSNCKDLRTQLSKFCKGITNGKEWIMGLTGTPVVNKPKDLVSQLSIIGALGLFGGYTTFVNRFCQGYSQASNLRELNYMLHKNGFFRRLKKEVLQDLPDKMRNIFRVEITNRQEYVKAENNLVSYLRENLLKSEGEITKALRGEAMVLIGILKKISARGKIDAIVEMINEVVDGGEKIIVFAWHKEVVRSIQERVPGSLTIVGDNSLKERQYAVDAFQNNPDNKVIICNIQSGGVGITLTASSRVAFIELPWHPAHADQAEDRAWRIGQKNSVDCRYLLGMNTIDDYIYKIIDKKRAIVSQVTGAENEIATSVIDEFINLFSKERC